MGKAAEVFETPTIRFCEPANHAASAGSSQIQESSVRMPKAPARLCFPRCPRHIVAVRSKQISGEGRRRCSLQCPNRLHLGIGVIFAQNPLPRQKLLTESLAFVLLRRAGARREHRRHSRDRAATLKESASRRDLPAPTTEQTSELGSVLGSSKAARTRRREERRRSVPTVLRLANFRLARSTGHSLRHLHEILRRRDSLETIRSRWTKTTSLRAGEDLELQRSPPRRMNAS
mmetsp:Transcript_4305/g.13169  ORF Transcript_4305/g.13169 Transcript_4305/m.13169 type:complete len:232 (+) Transcript_4305:785-1480(+)